MNNMEPNRFQFDAETMKVSMKVIVARLMKLALTGEHRQFEYIRNWDMRRLAVECEKTTKRVIRYFKACKANADRLLKQDVASREFDAEVIKGVVQFGLCVSFYEEELRILRSMLSEYRRYMFSFHLLDTFVWNRWRPDRECYDHRRIFGKR